MTVVALSARAAAARLAGRVRRHPVALAVTGGVIALQAVYQAGMALCPRMTMTACLAAAILVVLGASVIAMAARAAWLGAAAARAVAALPSAAPPEALAGAARRAGIRRIRCLAGSGATAFCAGLLAPRVYITAAAVTTLGPGALDAVLVHEAAHARRRDPLRRLAARAASDALFYLPLARWCPGRPAPRRRPARAAPFSRGGDRVGRRADRRGLAGDVPGPGRPRLGRPGVTGHARPAPRRGTARHRGGLGDNDPERKPRVAPGGSVRGFGELEAAIMDRIWSADGPLLVRQVHATLRPERAYNTVLTVVEILYRKGWLAREKEGRAYRYRATVTREDYAAGLMGEALDASTDRAATLRRFAERIGPDEAGQLHEALEQARRAGERR